MSRGLRSQHGAGSEAAEDSEPVACPGGQIEEKLYLPTCFQQILTSVKGGFTGLLMDEHISQE